jgi:putative flippase GtrA
MNEFIRWGKFNLIGAMGMLVQLAALSFFNRLMAGHYLFASAVAIELTLVHNFIWHLHYTWRDRRDCGTRLRQLVRFHLSNGSTSMLGNLALMRLLVHGGHLPLLLSNSIAILCCSIANFFLGNNWAFSRVRKTDLFSESKIAGPASVHNCSLRSIPYNREKYREFS